MPDSSGLIIVNALASTLTMAPLIITFAISPGAMYFFWGGTITTPNLGGDVLDRYSTMSPIFNLLPLFDGGTLPRRDTRHSNKRSGKVWPGQRS
jgi:hypothetical protein